MTSRRSVVPNAAPLPASRNTSRSVKIPTGSGPSHTTTEPTPASSIVRIASAAVWSGLAVTSCVRITPPICIFHLHRRLVTNDTILHAPVVMRLGSRQGSRPGRKGSCMAGVTFDGVTKTYMDGTTAVNSLDLDVEDGEFMVLVGPSGCGKTTARRMVAGLEDISRGVLKIGERVVNHVPSRDRDIAMVFQSYALYPHLTVYDNIAFGLKIKKLPKDEIEKRVENAARILGLEPFLKRKPRALSGGQRQRVAMGRAIVREPAAFLMDEPLSNLDAKLRVQMRAEIAGLQHDLGVTTIYVTHDQVEAMTMGDRVAVMRKGELQQVADPQTLYDRPVNLFVGGFIGSPAMNMIEATLERQNGGFSAKVGDQSITIESDEVKARPGLRGYEGRKVIIGIRPEDLEDANLETDAPENRRLSGRLELREALGSEIMAHFAIKGATAETDETRELAKDSGAEGTEPQIGVGEGEAIVVGRFGGRSKGKQGDNVSAVVDTRALHFFDPETGSGIYDSPKGAQT